MKGMVYQTPLIQLVINLLITILETANVLERVVSTRAKDKLHFKEISNTLKKTDP